MATAAISFFGSGGWTQPVRVGAVLEIVSRTGICDAKGTVLLRRGVPRQNGRVFRDPGSSRMGGGVQKSATVPAASPFSHRHMRTLPLCLGRRRT